MAMMDTPHHDDLAWRRAGVRRTVWICVIVVAVLLGLFWAQHVL
ncbi:MAG TPA: hypothetical protein VFG67_01895 [Oleiagrimonas sp.]|nr:hypothetical protein [Oleiagrimonas sp.]